MSRLMRLIQFFVVIACSCTSMLYASAKSSLPDVSLRLSSWSSSSSYDLVQWTSFPSNLDEYSVPNVVISVEPDSISKFSSFDYVVVKNCHSTTAPIHWFAASDVIARMSHSWRKFGSAYVLYEADDDLDLTQICVGVDIVQLDSIDRGSRMNFSLEYGPKMPVGGIVGLVIGGVIVIAICWFCCCRNKRSAGLPTAAATGAVNSNAYPGQKSRLAFRSSNQSCSAAPPPNAPYADPQPSQQGYPGQNQNAFAQAQIRSSSSSGVIQPSYYQPPQQQPRPMPYGLV